MTVQLRPYQEECVAAHWRYLEACDGNPLFVVPTAGGKSHIIAAFLQRSIEAWPSTRAIVLTHVKELIEQNYGKYLEHVGALASAGVYSAGIGARDTQQSVIFAGIQSMYSRAGLLGRFDLVLVDECHLIPKKGEGRYLTYLEALRRINPHMRVLGYTATNYRLDGGYLHKGPGRIFTDVAYEIPIDRLVREGFLSPLIGKKPGAGSIDTSGIATVNGDFKRDDLEAAAMRAGCVEAAIAEVVRYGREQSRQSWLLFSCGIEHGLRIGDELAAHGISWRFVHGGTPKDDRRRAVEQFKRGEFQALVNVGVFCLDEQTEILTTDGWTGIDRMTMEHQVAAWDVDGSIVFTPPKVIIRRPRLPGEQMVSVAGKDQNIRVTSNHRMIIRTGKTCRWAIRPALEVAGRCVFLPTSGVATPLRLNAPAPQPSRLSSAARTRALAYVRRESGMDASSARASAMNRTAIVDSLRYKDPDDLSEDECRFVGFFLGNGSLGNRCEFSQSLVYPRIVQWFDDLLCRLRMPHSRHERIFKSTGGRYVVWSINRGTGGLSQQREGGYVALTPYLQKAGSRLYWGFSGVQFAALLEGFWLADGNHGQGDGNRDRGRSIAGTQLELYELLQAVGACRGFRCTVTPRSAPSNPNHSQQWRFSWRRSTQARQLRQRMAVEPEWKVERVWCVTSTTGNIVTRRKGKVAVVGNTTGFDAPNVDLLAILRATQSTGLYVQLMGRGMRLSPATGKKDCLVLDFGTNIERHGPVDRVKPKRESASGESPVKACPKCASYVPAGVAACPDCGYVFPARVIDGPSHEKRASHQSPMSTGNEAPTTFDVTGVFYRDHVAKSSGLKTLRVDYLCGMRAFSEFVCLDHSGFALRKAQRWWLEHSTARGSPVPSSVLAALERKGELRTPVQIDVVHDGKYERVARVRWTRRTVAANPGAEGSRAANS